MPENAKVVDLVIQGSGVRAVAALGVITALHDAGYQFARISGTSSGALLGAVVMAYQKADKDLHEISDVLAAFNPTLFEAAPAAERLTGLLGDGWEALTRGGAYSIERVRDWLAGLLEETGITRFGDLREDDPGSSLPESQRYSLVVHASDITRHAWVRLPWDYPEYGLTADEQPIADAVAASLAFPLVFDAVQVTTGSGELVTWIDGGLMADYPLTIFDRTDGKDPRWPTWGIQLMGEPAAVSREIRSVPDTMVNTLMTMLQWNRYGLNEQGPGKRELVINTGPDDPRTELNLNMTKEQTTAFYQQGQQVANDFLKNLNTGG